MSNIRTLKDLEKGPNTQPLPNPWQNQQNQQPRQQQNSRVRTYSDEPFIGQQNAGQAGGMQYIGLDGYPHTMPATELSQKPLKSCCLMCCPCFVDPCGQERRQEWVRLFQSFMFVVSVIQIIMFIVELSLDGFASTKDNPMLGPPASSMNKLGAKNSYLEKDGQVYRFFVPIFLHAGFIHILFNIFAQLRYGLILERQWGIPTTMIIYFISGIAGNLFSSLVEPRHLGVGASGAILGLMGAQLAELIWRGQKYEPTQRKMNIAQLVFIIVITMVLSSAPFIDWSAHLGGVIIGFALACYIFTRDDMSNAPKFVTWSGLATVIIFFILGFVLFYTVLDV